jgi:steroid delta-isomerase-like uncharacterized protein
MSITQTTENNKAIVRKLVEDCLNTGELALLNMLVSDDYVGPTGQKGPAGFADTVRALRQAFPDIRWTIEDLFAAGDRVALRWQWQGTHEAPFRNFPASRKTLTNTAIAIFQLKDNRIVQGWVQTDQLGFLQQIGAVPQDIGLAPQPQK